MPAAHTAERATRSQRGTDTRSRTGAAILPPPSAAARRARAPAPDWLAGRARPPAPPMPTAPDVALRDDVTSGRVGELGARRGAAGGDGAAWRPRGGAAGRRCCQHPRVSRKNNPPVSFGSGLRVGAGRDPAVPSTRCAPQS